MNINRSAVTAALLVLGLQARASQWYTHLNGAHLEFAYGTPSNAPQYGVFDLNSSYLRLNYGPSSGWGTSIDTMPCFWSGGGLHQGYPVSASAQVSGPNLVLTVIGASSGLTTHETITVAPPKNFRITAIVSAQTSGTVALDGNRPGEAFKPVFLSSMHDSATSWDASSPFAKGAIFAFPTGGWIITPGAGMITADFGLLGGTSSWKPNAPSVRIALSTPMQIAGWLTTDNNPNDDNVGFWAATSYVPTSWSYQIIVSRNVPLLTPVAPPIAPALR